MNTVKSHIIIILNREENHLNIHDSYLDIEFIVSDNAGAGAIANGGNIEINDISMCVPGIDSSNEY